MGVYFMQSTLYDQFEQQAKSTPSKPCLSNGEKTFSYAQALELIDVISCQLQRKGVQSGNIVAIYSEKNITSVLSFLAISRLGATVLTLDTAFPAKMLSFVLEDANVQWIISEHTFPVKVSLPVLFFSELMAKTESSFTNCHTPVPAPAWLVYSSGTTGNPKGIVISHQAILSSIFSRYQFSDYQSNDKVACSIYFYWEVFRPLFRGACVYVIEDRLLLDIKNYTAFIHQHGITETLWTPSYAQMLLQCLDFEQLRCLLPLKRVWLNGEVVCRQLTEEALAKLSHIDFFNLYSISETFDVAARSLSHQNISEDGFASIGYPLSQVEALVLNENEKRCLPREQGELYISSPFLANGYLNQNELQKQSFKDVHIEGKKKRFFKTKDVARQNEDGEIFILGRNDHVVKLRGYNISLLAIEDTIKQHLPVRQCVVTIEGHHPASQMIVAFLQPENLDTFISTYELDIESGLSAKLQAFLKYFLPHYAIPAKFSCVHSLQWNRYSAKLDRKSTKQSAIGETVSAHASQSNAIALKGIWHEVLQLPRELIHENSDFFILGGHSLQAIQFIQRFNQHFTKKLDLNRLYQLPVFAEQLHWLTNDEPPENSSNTSYILNDANVQFSSSVKPPRHSNLATAKAVFITGTTGFLGAHWLASCLKQTACRYYCLIRCENKERGFHRLKETFKKYRLDTSLLNGRIEVIPGTLIEPQFGLEAKNWDFLTHEIDVILHAAATVNLLYPYDKLRASIVEGTKTILTLATTQSLKPTVLISSDAVFSHAAHSSASFLPKSSFYHLSYGYAQAKWIQEQLVQAAASACQLPYCVVRLGNLSASLKTGIGNDQDANHLLMKWIKQQGYLPQNIFLEFTPVDLIADVLSKQCLNKIEADVFSLSQLNCCREREISALLADWPLRSIQEQDWLQLLEIHEPALHALWQIENLFSAKAYTLKDDSKRECYSESLTLSPHELRHSLLLLAEQHETILTHEKEKA
ncbi:AMP-binding protein [Legionella israelensis]|nr:AMP-binding protein [Legionella israelensis]